MNVEETVRPFEDEEFEVEEFEDEKSVSPFVYVNSINTGKNNMMRDSENDVLSEKQYNPWIVNIALSYFPDTILHANLMNECHHLENRPQYEFLLNSIRRDKRWSKWIKKTPDKDLDFVCEYYQCNKTVGRVYLSLLTKEQLTVMMKNHTKGGR